jgi:hypothetical protein
MCKASVKFVKAVGGAVALVVGVFAMNSAGPRSPTGSAIIHLISVQDSSVAVNHSKFEYCSVTSLTDSSLGTASVYGGAFAVLHDPQVSNFRIGISGQPLNANDYLFGSKLTVMISNSHFVECSISSSASKGRLDIANGGGGAVYARSVALSDFNVMNCAFISNSVNISSAADGFSSFSYGGALAVVDKKSNGLFVLNVTSCQFFNNSVTGAFNKNVAVRGGAVYASRAALVCRTFRFIVCLLRISTFKR